MNMNNNNDYKVDDFFISDPFQDDFDQANQDKPYQQQQQPPSGNQPENKQFSDKTQKEFTQYIDSMTYQEPYMQKNMFIANQRAYQKQQISPPEFQDHMIRTSSIIDRIYPQPQLPEQPPSQGISDTIYDPFRTNSSYKESVPKLEKFDSSHALFESEDEINYKQIIIDDQRQVLMRPELTQAPCVETKTLPPSEILKSKSFPFNSEKKLIESAQVIAQSIPMPQEIQMRRGSTFENSSSKTIKKADNFQTNQQHEDLKAISDIFDKDLFDRISDFDHIKKTEEQLEVMKHEIKDKKRLQKERNVLTAQLSRDRKKLEVELLRQYCLKTIQALNTVKNSLNEAKSKSKCAKCGDSGGNSGVLKSVEASLCKFEDFKLYENCSDKSGSSNSESLSHTHIDEEIDQSQIYSDQIQVDFENLKSKPNLVTRMTRVKKEETQTDFKSNKSKRTSKMDSKVLGKRQIDSPKPNSAFSVFPSGQNKVAKYGAAVASVLAVSIALFGSQDQQQASNYSLSDSNSKNRRNLLEIVEPEVIESIEFGSWQNDDHSTILTSIQVFEEKEDPLQILPSHSEYNLKPSDFQFVDPLKTLGLNRKGPCKNLFNARQFLQQTYMIENLREDFLKRELEKLCGHDLSNTEEPIFQEEVTSPVVYTQTDYEHENGAKMLADPSQGQCQQSTADAQKLLNEKTITMFAGNPQLIMPIDERGNTMMDLNFSSQQDISKESYLHLVLPAKEINILNPQKLFTPNSDSGFSQQSEVHENMFVEIGCKVFEINHINYNPQEI